MHQVLQSTCNGTQHGLSLKLKHYSQRWYQHVFVTKFYCHLLLVSLINVQVGFQVLDALAAANSITWMKKLSHRAQVAHGRIQGVPVILCKPMAYMNVSGESVGPLVTEHRLNRSQVRFTPFTFAHICEPCNWILIDSNSSHVSILSTVFLCRGYYLASAFRDLSVALLCRWGLCNALVPTFLLGPPVDLCWGVPMIRSWMSVAGLRCLFVLCVPV
jgi:hypothetical protein